MSTATVEAEVKNILEHNWNDKYGYTAPNVAKYPYQWLWDSCFHAIVWAHYNDKRCVREMDSLFGKMQPSGFLPNMMYRPPEKRSRFLWKNGLQGTSDITQPPVFGHTLRVLHDRGFDVAHLYAPATKALMFLFDNRMDNASGLLKIIHPWESGCDDSARYDSWHHGDFHRSTWNIRKYVMLRRIKLNHGASLANPMFEVCSTSFNAIAAYSAKELASLTHDTELAKRADDLIAAIERTWSEEQSTWVNVPVGRKARPSSSKPTLDSFLPLLVSTNPDHKKKAWDALFNPDKFFATYGLRGIEKDDTTYVPNGYWRGGTWAQLNYLLWTAAVEQHHPNTKKLANAIVRGAQKSHYAEHWNPETGQGNGAIPLGFSTLATVTAQTL